MDLTSILVAALMATPLILLAFCVREDVIENKDNFDLTKHNKSKHSKSQ